MKALFCKKIFLCILVLFPTLVRGQAPDFRMVGFAALDNGTSGGEGGQIVTPQTFAELRQYVEDNSTPYIIRIEKEFNTGVETWVDEDGRIVDSDANGAVQTTFGAILKAGSNKTLIGIGDQGFFNRIGLVSLCLKL